MKKNILIIILSLLVVFLTGAFIIKTNDTNIDIEPTIAEVEIETSEAATEPTEVTEIILDVIEVEIVEPKTWEEANVVLDGITMRLTNAVELLNTLNALGYSEDHPAVVLAKTEILNAENNFKHYEIIWQKFEEERKWEARMNEYPAATEIWLYLKQLGYNDWVCAGIMGNLMAEAGGQTLKISHSAQSDNYYGICQWSRSYDRVWGTDLKTQCDFLAQTIQYEIDTFGYAYQKGFSYNDFLNLTNEKDAALAFAKAYERCSSASHSIRQANATAAYEYFTS